MINFNTAANTGLTRQLVAAPAYVSGNFVSGNGRAAEIENANNWNRWFFTTFAFVAMFFLAMNSVHSFAASSEPITDDVFVRDAYLNAQTEIEMSRIALQKSPNAKTKKLAKSLIKDHTAAITQLRVLAGSRRLEVPTALDKDRQQQVAVVQSSGKDSFDAAYSAQLQKIHVAAIDMFDRVAKNPRADAEFRVFASQRLPLFRKDQPLIEKIGATPKVAQR